MISYQSKTFQMVKHVSSTYWATPLFLHVRRRGSRLLNWSKFCVLLPLQSHQPATIRFSIVCKKFKRNQKYFASKTSESLHNFQNYFLPRFLLRTVKFGHTCKRVPIEVPQLNTVWFEKCQLWTRETASRHFHVPFWSIAVYIIYWIKEDFQ